MNGIPDPGGPSGAFAALERTTIAALGTAALTCISDHHSITEHTHFADVVVACACTPSIRRDAAAWAAHVARTWADIRDTLTSDASHPPAAASADGRPAPVEEAGAGRVIPFPTK